MLNENYKKTLSNSQRYVFERLEKELQDKIDKTQNELNALELLAYCPKKDGTPKSNFALNFGLVAPWGESYKWASRYQGIETRRYVEIWFDRSLVKGDITDVKFRFKPYWDDENGTDPKPATNFEYFEGTLYMRPDAFKEWAGFDIEKEQSKIDAPFVFKALKEYYADKRRAALEGYRNEIKELPKWFKKACDMARKMRDLVDGTEHLTTIHSFMYSNFEAKETHYLNH